MKKFLEEKYIELIAKVLYPYEEDHELLQEFYVSDGKNLLNTKIFLYKNTYPSEESEKTDFDGFYKHFMFMFNETITKGEYSVKSFFTPDVGNETKEYILFYNFIKIKDDSFIIAGQNKNEIDKTFLKIFSFIRNKDIVSKTEINQKFLTNVHSIERQQLNDLLENNENISIFKIKEGNSKKPKTMYKFIDNE